MTDNWGINHCSKCGFKAETQMVLLEGKIICLRCICTELKELRQRTGECDGCELRRDMYLQEIDTLRRKLAIESRTLKQMEETVSYLNEELHEARKGWAEATSRKMPNCNKLCEADELRVQLEKRGVEVDRLNAELIDTKRDRDMLYRNGLSSLGQLEEANHDLAAKLNKISAIAQEPQKCH